MNTLMRHFEACALPLQFIDDDPRPQSSEPQEASADDLLYLDVATDATRQEYFRLWLGDGTTIHLRHKQPATRHILVQAQIPFKTWGAYPTTRDYLLGHDERQLFITPTPANVGTVNEALLALGPTGTKRRIQRNRGRKIIRQGDWFFEPLGVAFEPRQPLDMYLRRNLPLGGLMAAERGIQVGNPHLAEEQVFFGRWYNARWNLHRPLRGIFVRGNIRHVEHKTVKLRGWYRAWQRDMAGRWLHPNSSIGYYD